MENVSIQRYFALAMLPPVVILPWLGMLASTLDIPVIKLMIVLALPYLLLSAAMLAWMRGRSGQVTWVMAYRIPLVYLFFVNSLVYFIWLASVEDSGRLIGLSLLVLLLDVIFLLFGYVYLFLVEAGYHFLYQDNNTESGLRA